ncbi:tyrosine-type recombinase/integrase [Lentilactobacillus farraginis]|uniref:tyrosine-type recombinase/integrase n=1 Tax=Lentilactobacillus farraginis TaxID=390841 RepID=UPI00068ED07D|nr:tyrosine-type recombinase/integrase [Lentilactobacillus farraginis]
MAKLGSRTSQRLLIKNFYGNGDGTDAHPAHAKATAEKINTHIRACVKNAINEGIIHHDFTANTHLVFDPKHTRGIHYLNLNQATELVHYLKAHLDLAHMTNYMSLTALMTGMRAAEITALTWDSLDRKKHMLKIDKSWDFSLKNFKATKNHSSNRTIEINPQLIEVLTKLQFDQNMYLNTHHKTNPKNLIFMTRYGNVPEYNALNHHVTR